MPSPNVSGKIIPSVAGAVQAYDANGNPIQVAPGATGTVLTSNGTTSTPSFQAAAGGGGFIQTLVAPVSGNFTAQNFNTGSGVTTTQFNNSTPVTSISLIQHDPNNTGNIVAIDKTAIAATFTLSVGFILAPAGGSTSNGGGLWLSNGASPPGNILFGWQGNTNTGQGLVAFYFTSFLTSSLTTTIFHTDTHFSPPIIWVRIKETVATRFFYVSSDGANWMQVYQEPVATHFVTSRYGFQIFDSGTSTNAPDGMATLYSFQETNP